MGKLEFHSDQAPFKECFNNVHFLHLCKTSLGKFPVQFHGLVGKNNSSLV